MTIDSLQGPLTAADLRAIWEGAVDKSYSLPLLRAGEGQGLEVYGQAWAQLARVALAIDRTTQQLYIQPWSGQSSEPASDGRSPLRGAQRQLWEARRAYAMPLKKCHW